MKKLLTGLALLLLPAAMLHAQATTGENTWQGDQTFKGGLYGNPIKVNPLGNDLCIGSSTCSGDLTVTGTAVTDKVVIVNGKASATGDLQEWQVAAATVTVVGAQGHVILPQYYKASIDALVPDGLNALIFCKDCAAIAGGTGAVCRSSGTAVDQWVNISSYPVTAGTIANTAKGCGAFQ